MQKHVFGLSLCDSYTSCTKNRIVKGFLRLQYVVGFIARSSENQKARVAYHILSEEGIFMAYCRR